MGKIEHSLVQKIVLDAGPIIHLEEIGRLNLLSDFKDILVPEVVWEEIEYHRPLALQIKSVPFRKIKVSSEIRNNVNIIGTAFNLDKGEKEAISLCIQHKGSILLTDDAAARLAANSINIRAYGTIGILLRAIRRNMLKPIEVIGSLEQIPITSSLFIKKNLLNEIIENVRKEYSL